MTKARDPYSRVYWKAIDDPKFARVWDDDHALSAWLRLLVAADMAWPASATLYHGVRKAALRLLCDVGLVDMQAGGRYRIHGLDKERNARSEAAREAVNIRHHGRPDGAPAYTDEDYARSGNGVRPYPDGNAEGIPSQAEQSRDEQSRAKTSTDKGARGSFDDQEARRHGLPHLTPEVAAVIEAAVGRSMTTCHGWPATELDRLVEERPATLPSVGAAIALTGPHPSWAQFVGALRGIVEPQVAPVRETPAEAREREIREAAAHLTAASSAVR